MSRDGLRIGVVLSGGGAKGAYQVGFLKALAEYDIQPCAIAGTSIGAVNGAICASAKNTQEAYERVECLWEKIKSDNPLINTTKEILETFKGLSGGVRKSYSHLSLLPNVGKIASNLMRKNSARIYQNQYMFKLLQESISLEKLRQGLPMYVAITQTDHRTEIDMIKLLLGYLTEKVPFLKHKATFIKLQEKANEEIYQYIVASSALPFVFEAQEIEGKKYRDGCLADSPYGNIPITPLLDEEKCDFVLVCHLSRDYHIGLNDLENRKKIIEFFPRKECFTSPFDPLCFSQTKKLEEWVKIGYEDTKKGLEDLLYRQKISRYLGDLGLR